MRKSVLDPCDCQGDDSMVEIAAWTQEHFQKSLFTVSSTNVG